MLVKPTSFSAFIAVFLMLGGCGPAPADASSSTGDTGEAGESSDDGGSTGEPNSEDTTEGGTRGTTTHDPSGSSTSCGFAGCGSTTTSGSTGDSFGTSTSGPPDTDASDASTGDPTGQEGGSSGGDDGGGDPVPSAGCGNPTPPSGAIGSGDGRYTVSLPDGYDPDRPYRLGFAFHGYGRTSEEAQSVDLQGVQSQLGGDSILVYMKSVGPGWEQAGSLDPNVANFETVLDRLLAEACVDESRIFVTGHSSGAGFANILGCRYGDILQAVAPVGGSVLERQGCVGNPAAIVVHGVDDNFRNNGESSRDFWATRSECSEPGMDLAALEARIRDARRARSDDPENIECTAYQGCLPGATVTWCIHGQDGYDDTTHGWPTRGGEVIRAALEAL